MTLVHRASSCVHGSIEDAHTCNVELHVYLQSNRALAGLTEVGCRIYMLYCPDTSVWLQENQLALTCRQRVHRLLRFHGVPYQPASQFGSAGSHWETDRCLTRDTELSCT